MPNPTNSAAVEKTMKNSEKQRRRSPYAFLRLARVMVCSFGNSLWNHLNSAQSPGNVENQRCEDLADSTGDSIAETEA